MASTIVSEISRHDVEEIQTPSSASITNVNHLSSYNWIEAPTPTIAVPGSPDVWSPPRGTQQLKKDSGLVYIAQNAARHPDSPLEPLFRSLYLTHPSYDIQKVNVVTDRNNIRKLLSFINPGSSKFVLEEFTIRVEVNKNTAIFCRDEAVTQEFIGPAEFKGFGHEFEKRYTKHQINGSTGHHRIISYRFGYLNFIVRYENDGYVDVDAKTTSSSTIREAADNILSDALESLSISASDSRPTTKPLGSKLSILEQGRVIPLASTLEIKTRVMHRPLGFPEVAPQLWASQTPKLVRAYHQKGKFEQPQVENVEVQIKMWERGNQRDLRKLHGLIEKIVSVVKGCGGRGVVNYKAEGDKLVVRKCDKDMPRMLPNDLYLKWDNTDTDEAKLKEESLSSIKPDVGTENKVRKASISGAGATNGAVKKHPSDKCLK